MPVYDDGDDGNYPLLGDLVPWPLLLITFGAAMAVLVIETWVGRQAGNDWWQAVTQNLEKPVYTAILCVIAGNTARLAKEGIMWLAKEKARYKARVTAEVAEKVAAEVTERVSAEVREQVSAEVTERVSAEVREQVSAEVTERVSAEVREQVTAEVTEQVGARVAAHIGSERDKAWVEWLKSQNITPPETPPQLSER